MSPSRRTALSLPVLPTNRRRVALLPVPAQLQRQRRQSFERLGLLALCTSAAVMVTALLTFTILRDQAGMRSTEPLLQQPLRP